MSCNQDDMDDTIIKKKHSKAADPLLVFAQRYHAFFNSTTDGVAVFTHDGQILDANRTLQSLAGFSYDDLVSRSSNDLFSSADNDIFMKALLSVTRGKELKNPVEINIHNKKGRDHTVEANFNLLRDQYGFAKTVLVLIRDITRRKKAESELVQRAEELQRVFDAVPTILALVDERKRIRRINTTGVKIIGLTTREIEGRRLGEVLVCQNHAKSKRGCGIGALCKRCVINESINRSIKAGERVIGAEESIVRDIASAEPCYYKINTIPLVMNTKRWAVVSLEDITDRKHAELESIRLNDSIARANIELKESLEKLARSQSQLIESQKLEQIGLLASGLAHNLKTPLGGIKGYAQLLALDHKNSHELNMILEEVEVMENIIENLMIKSRKNHNIKEEKIDFNDLIQIELKFLNANMFFKHKVKKHIELDTDLPKVFGTYTHFSQILMNVISNALDAMYNSEQKDLTIRTRHTDTMIYIDVIDTGYGIPHEIQNEIFKPFFTTKPSPNENREDEPFGTGLGLSSANYFIHQYGGNISLDSAEGSGTTVTISLPYTHDVTPGRVRKILIVDDFDSMVDILVEVCQDMGMEAYGASNGEEAIDLYHKIEPDLVVSDLCIPGISGPQLIQEIRAINPAQPVIYVTGYYENPDYKQWLSSEMQKPSINAVLKKPFQLEYFKDIVQRMITCA